MKLIRTIGSVTAVVALAAAGVLFSAHAVKSSDHQDTYNLANSVGHNASADITDVFVFPDPNDATKVVFAMNTWPLISAGAGPTKFFDPTILWQFKISHGAAAGPEDQVIQFAASTNMSTSQQIAVYGPAKPNEVGVANTLVPVTGTVTYNNTSGTALSNGIQVFAGPRADPFVFDLFGFFSNLGDRYYGIHTSQNDAAGNATANTTLSNGNTTGLAAQVASSGDKARNPQLPPAGTGPTFNGFTTGTTSTGTAAGYLCSTEAPVNALADLAGGFNVLSFVVEVPKTLLTTGYSSPMIHVWATASSNSTNS